MTPDSQASAPSSEQKARMIQEHKENVADAVRQLSDPAGFPTVSKHSRARAKFFDNINSLRETSPAFVEDIWRILTGQKPVDPSVTLAIGPRDSGLSALAVNELKRPQTPRRPPVQVQKSPRPDNVQRDAAQPVQHQPTQRTGLRPDGKPRRARL